MAYPNGEIPLDKLIYLGGDHYLTPGTNARWQWVVEKAFEKYGVRLRITPGANGYRWLEKQIEARIALGIWAAIPGKSSHGGTFNGRECMAIDVYNWAELGWARFAALCRLAGFTVNFVTPEELWHIGDFNDIWTIPDWLVKSPEQEEDEDMAKPVYVFAKAENVQHNLIYDTSSGFEDYFTSNDGTYNTRVIQGYGIAVSTEISYSHLSRLREELAAVRRA